MVTFENINTHNPMEKGHVVQEAERLKDAERQREQDSEERHRDRGMDHGM